MNEEACTPKDLNLIMEDLGRFRESRSKLITAINDVLDRLKQNRKGKPPEQKDACLITPGVPVFVNDLREHLRSIDLDNEELSLILQRLNELI